MRLPGAKVQGNPTEEIRKCKYFYFSGWMMPLFSLNKISKWDQPFSYHILKKIFLENIIMCDSSFWFAKGV